MHSSADAQVPPRAVVRMALIVAVVVAAGGGTMAALGMAPVYFVFAAAGAVLAVSLVSRASRRAT